MKVSFRSPWDLWKRRWCLLFFIKWNAWSQAKIKLEQRFYHVQERAVTTFWLWVFTNSSVSYAQAVHIFSFRNMAMCIYLLLIQTFLQGTSISNSFWQSAILFQHFINDKQQGGKEIGFITQRLNNSDFEQWISIALLRCVWRILVIEENIYQDYHSSKLLILKSIQVQREGWRSCGKQMTICIVSCFEMCCSCHRNNGYL